MSLPSPAEIATHVSAGLNVAARFAAPFPHFYADDLFPEPVVAALTALELPPPRGSGSGRRDDIAGRIFFGAAEMARFPVMRAVAEALQMPCVARRIAALTGAPIAGARLRLEYAIDRTGFWLAPHTDIGAKKFTGLIGLATDATQADLGTDLYASRETPAAKPTKRAPFRRNGALMFVPSSESWHGFAPRGIKGTRRSLILNYVGPEWRAKEQLAFPDRPVVLA